MNIPITKPYFNEDEEKAVIEVLNGMKLEIIERTYREKAEKTEFLRKELLEKTFRVVEELSGIVSFEEAYIFGSLTKPYRFGEFSDIDIALKGFDKDKLTLATSFLSRNLERDVNVVPLEEIHFAERIIMGGGIKWKRG
ncbi:MAG: nucleotidyltransferase domain-containing protein [bacterium]